MKPGVLHDRVMPVSRGLLAAGIVVWAIGAAIFFRYPLLSSFDLVFGERSDGRMLIYFHEHLFKALQGHAELLSPGFYYPAKFVLGMGPAFLLNLAPYAIFRAAGCDPFLAFELVLVILSLACFLACLVVATRYLQVRPALALCAALLMTFPNSFFIKAGGHANLLMLYYVPCIVALALWGIEDFPRVSKRNIARIAIAAALLALLFSTDVYSAWMFGFTLLIAAGTLAVLRGRRLIAFVRQHRRPLTTLAAAAAIAFGIALVPFVLIYVPVRAIAPLRSYWEYRIFAPFPPDLINVSHANLVWGWLADLLRQRPGIENVLAVTPGMTVLFFLFAWLLRRSPQPAPWQTVFVACAAAVWIVSWLLTVRIGTVSGFWLVRYLVPGATGIRAGMRVQIMVNFWIVLGLVVALEHWLRTAPRNASSRLSHRRAILAGGVLLFCLVEQVNLADNAQLSRRRELAFLASVPQPPAECRAFFVDAAPRSPDRAGPRNVVDDTDAMWIALRTGLSTLNGLSGWSPPGWKLGETADNFSAVRHWIAHTALREQVCLYDRAARRWSLFQ